MVVEVQSILPKGKPFEQLSFKQQKIYIVSSLVDTWSKCLGDEIVVDCYESECFLVFDHRYVATIGLEGADLMSVYQKTIRKLQKIYDDAT